MMKVLYVGATGLVGSQVVPILKAKSDFDLTLAALGGGEVADLPVKDVDVTNWESVDALLQAGTAQGEPFDAVVNCAIADYRNVRRAKDMEGRRDYDERCIDVNARGAYHLYEAAWRAGVSKVVYIGSMTAVLGKPRYDMIDQQSRERPGNVYAACKIFGEHVGRCFAYSSREHEHAMQVLCLRLGQPYPSHSGFDQSWQNSPQARAMTVDVQDIAHAIECALRADVQYGVYPIVSGSDVPYIDPDLYAEIGYKPAWKFTDEGRLPVNGTENFKPQPLLAAVA